MEYFTAYHFIQKYGWDSFTKFCEMMNSGSSLAEMSAAIGLSMAQLSRYRSTLFDVRYIPKFGTQKAMQEFADRDRLRSERKEEFTLRLLGAK